MQKLTFEKRFSTKEKAAILFATLGKDYAAKLMSGLEDDEVKNITVAIATMGAIKKEVRQEIIAEFYQVCLAQQLLVTGGIDEARDILIKSFGEKKAAEIINSLSSAIAIRPFKFLQNYSQQSIFNTLTAEHPQTKAIILSYCDPQIAADYLNSQEIKTRSQLVERMGSIESIDTEQLKLLESLIEEKLRKTASQQKVQLVGGVGITAEILLAMTAEQQREIFDRLEDTAEEQEDYRVAKENLQSFITITPKNQTSYEEQLKSLTKKAKYAEYQLIQAEKRVMLAEELRQKLFLFEDITLLDVRSFQWLYRACQPAIWMKALKSADPRVVEFVFKNVSSRNKEDLQEGMKDLQIRRSESENSQREIINSLLQEAQSADPKVKLPSKNGGGDEFI